jgi:hypothetical protein
MSPDRFMAFMSKTTSAPEISEQQVESSRYVLLRRLAPSLQHHMVRHLQPIGMIYGVMDHRLSTPAPDLRVLHKDADKINGFAKAALAQCIDVSSWLAPDPDVLTPAGQGVRDCVALVGASLNFRGFQVVNEVPDLNLHVRRCGLRMVLLSALMAATDALLEPATLTLRATQQKDHLDISLLVALRSDGEREAYDDGYRKISWADVEALAVSEDVSLTRQEGLVTMSFAIESPGPAH